MDELNELLKDIETLREDLIKLIEEKESNLQDPKVISASQILNAAIAKYNELIKKNFNP